MQGFNMGRYRPPDADPRTVPFNTTSHPLGKRARHLVTHGILTVRFELPFNVFCLSCSAHLAQGVRFNAAKHQAGEYMSTKIWAFTCKCPTCASKFEIRTDPQHAQYTVEYGVKRQSQEWDPAENGGHPVYDKEKRQEGATDAFAQVEQQTIERAKAKQRERRVQELLYAQEKWADPYSANKQLRDTFRKDKRKRTQQLEQDLQVKQRIGWRDEKALLAASSPATAERETQLWKDAKTSARGRREKREVAEGGTTSTPAAQRLRATLVANTIKKRDPFLRQMRAQTDKSTASRSSSSKHI